MIGMGYIDLFLIIIGYLSDIRVSLHQFLDIISR